MFSGKMKIAFFLAIIIIASSIIAGAGIGSKNEDQLNNDEYSENVQNIEDNIALESGSLGSVNEKATFIGADGVGVINEATINNQAIGIEGVSMAATISSCTKISSPGTYTLTADVLGITTNPCIVITSSDVTLDGAGHLLDGQNSGTAIDVYNPQTALNNVNIKNMKITDWTYGIRYRGTILSTLSNNLIMTNNYGFYFNDYSGRNTFIGNNLTSNSYGFYIQTGYNNFTQNRLISNSMGFYLYDSDYNVLNDNIADRNSNAFYLVNVDNNTLNGNTATYLSSGNPTGSGFFLSSSTNNTLKNNKAIQSYGFHLSSSNKNILDTNNGSNSNYGLYLSSSNNNTIMNSIVANSRYSGIYLYYSNDNTIRRNIIRGAPTYYYGMQLYYSNRNKIYDNIFNNTNNVQFTGSIETWNLTRTIATNIVNGMYTAGNVWENPTKTGFSQICSDADRNGICDSAYPLDAANFDNLPLVHHFDNTIPKSVTNLVNTSYANNYIRWAWTDPSDIDFSYVKIYINGAFRTGVLNGVKAYNLTGLLPNMSYTIGTKTVDINGNENATLKTHTARTKPDNTVPGMVSGLHNTTYAKTYITWVWTDPSDYDLQYIKVYINGIFKENVPKGTQKYNATRLTNGTSYIINTRVQDTSSNIGAWNNNTAKTKP